MTYVNPNGKMPRHNRRMMSSSKLSLLTLFLPLLAAPAWLLYPSASSQEAAVPTEIAIDCADPHLGCHAGALQLRFTDPPSGTKPFRVEIVSTTQPLLQLEMADMAMAPVRYRATAAGNGQWHARLSLPLCSTTSKRWLLTIETDGKRYALPFVA